MAAAQFTLTLAQLVDEFGLELIGADQSIHGVCALSPGQAGCLAFAQDVRRLDALSNTQATAVLVPAKADLSGFARADISLLRAPHPQLIFARVAAKFAEDDRPVEGVDPSAVVDETAQLGRNVRIGAQCYIGAGAMIADGSAIGAGSIIGRNAKVGADADIGARVVVADRVEIGARVLILPGAVIGSRGFGNVHDGQKWHAMPQMGTVIIGDDVEIGANTTIDRGALGDTVIEDNVRIDNLCQIAHNVHIGPRTALASSVGIAGSTRVGADCLLGGQVGVNGHITICDKVVVNGGSNVMQSITEPGQYASGTPIMPVMPWRRFMALVGKLERRLKSLEKAIK